MKLRRSTRLVVSVTVALASLVATMGTAGAASPSNPYNNTYAFIQAKPGATDAETAANAALMLDSIRPWATIKRQLDMPNSYQIWVRQEFIPQLATAPGVGCIATAYTNDPWTAAAYWTWSGTQTGVYNPATDMHSPTNSAKAMGAEAYWNATPVAFKGQGVDVALIDTGISDAGDLRSSGVVIDGPDLSLDAATPSLRHLDGFGHGTHMAGIIHAAAPAARILNMKVGDAGGQVDVTQVIAAIDWVREHKTAYGLNVRVINLSYGVNSRHPSSADELSKAVDAAWKAGIVVVVSGGNGFKADSRWDPGLSSPAYNRSIIAVGAYDHGTSIEGNYDDTVSLFSSGASSSNKRNPDVVAPGASIASLRVKGSVADQQITDSVCAGGVYPVTVDGKYQRGSGSSQAAAFGSGAVALMLSKQTTMTPDEVKQMLRLAGRQVPKGNRVVSGEGSIDLKKISTAALPRNASQRTDLVQGGGNLDNTRDNNFVVDNRRLEERFNEMVAEYLAQFAAAGLDTDPAVIAAARARAAEQAPLAMPTLFGDKDIFGAPFSPKDHAKALDTGVATWSDGPAGQYYNGNLWVPLATQAAVNPAFGQPWTVGPIGDKYVGGPNGAFEPDAGPRAAFPQLFSGESMFDTNWVRAAWRNGGWVEQSFTTGSFVRASWRANRFVRAAWRTGEFVRASWRESAWADNTWL